MTNTQLWQSVLAEMELKLSKPSFITWFKDTKILKQSENEVIISVPNTFVREWLKNKFQKEILEALKVFLPKINKIKYVVSKQHSFTPKELLSAQKKDFSQPKIEFFQNQKTGLNPKYTFKNFVVGDFNRLAHACAFAIVKKLAKTYNPLFIYSGVGLGKTHLLEAIGNEIVNRHNKKAVKYIPCPDFTSKVIAAIRDQKIEKFVSQYNRFDILIIDDIEFLSGKERTQEVFFRIFNNLTENKGQIVLSSDRPPRVIEALEERLRSRFEGGMIADIGVPSFEERVAILEQKLEEKGVGLPQEIIDFIAQNFRRNIRDLEGALNRAIVLFEYQKSSEEIKNNLKQLVEVPKRGISAEKIISQVSDFYNVNKKDLISKSRKKELVFPRQVTMYLLRKELNLSLPSIGVKIGNRDHTTVMYGCEKIEEKLKKDEDFFKDLEIIKEKLYSL